MNRLYSFLLFLPLLLYSKPASTQNIAELRRLFKAATSGQCKSEALYKAIPVVPLQNKAVVMAYKGAGRTMMADCVFSPIRKQKYFNEGKELIEGAVSLAKNNIEVRFLRFIVQSNLPGFLGYDSLDEDSKFLCRAIPDACTLGQDKAYLLDVCAMMIAAGKLDDGDKATLQKLVEQEKK
jgi:hypothetical protein